MNATIASACLLLIGVSVVQAQQPVNDRVAKGMPTTYQPAQCNIKPNHFKVSSAAGYLKSAIETDVPENRTRILGQGEKVVLEAMSQNGQEKNPAAWYYLGRIYLMQGRLQPADSALSKAEQLAPDCAKDIATYRRNAWSTLVNAGSKFEQDKNSDSAYVVYQQANQIYRGSPVAMYREASILNDKGQTDSAAYWFGQAAAVSANTTDTTEQKYRNNSAYSQGVLLLNAKKYDQAAVVFEQYLKWVPSDPQAKRGLAAAYRGQGKTEQAQALDKELLASGGAGGAGASGGAGGAGAGAGGSADLMNTGITLFQEKKYADAATAFEKVVAAEPYNRDAVSSLANTYLALKNGPKLLSTAQRLVEIEPLSESALKLLGEGYKQTSKVDDAVKTAEQVLALPANVKAATFTPSANGASLTLTATGRTAQTAGGKAIAPVAIPITVEFLNAGGQPVATQAATIPPVASGASQDVKVDGQGAGIVAWRYKRK